MPWVCPAPLPEPCPGSARHSLQIPLHLMGPGGCSVPFVPAAFQASRCALLPAGHPPYRVLKPDKLGAEMLGREGRGDRWPQLARQQAARGARPPLTPGRWGGWMAAAPAPTTQKACPQPGLINPLHTAQPAPAPSLFSPGRPHSPPQGSLLQPLASGWPASSAGPQPPHELVQLQGPLQLLVPVGIAHGSPASCPHP